MRGVVVAFVVTRVALAIAVIVAVTSFATGPRPFCLDVSRVPLLNGLACWDAAGYVDIARAGYAGAGRENLAAYFPLYPLLMHIGGAVFGGSDEAYIAAGVVVSNVALFVAVIALAGLAARRLNDGSSGYTAAGFLMFPTTIFLSAVYADSLFIALAVTAGVAAEQRRWWRSGLLATAAALTRPFGVVAIVPLAVGLWRARAFRGGVTVAIAPAALALWLAYLYTFTGDPFVVFHGYTSGFTPRGPLQSFTDLLDPSVYGFPWFVAALFVLSAVLVAVSWRVAEAEYAAYATGMLLVIAAAGSLTSSMRYELSLYPAFVALGWVTRTRAIGVAWLSASALVALLFAAMFALGYWVG